MTPVLDTLLSPAWRNFLEITQKGYAPQLESILTTVYTSPSTVFPPQPLVFNALNLTPPNEVHVVILGQDPYHGKGQAHGLAFSVLPPTPPPPSLINIFKELQNNLHLPVRPTSGDLTHWAKQGVLLLNSTLTVPEAQPNAHKALGWQLFTDDVIRTLSTKRNDLIFVLWGAYARKKKDLIDTKRHLILEAPHPSPLSAHTGFFGCKHFGILNGLLMVKRNQPFQWVQ